MAINDVNIHIDCDCHTHTERTSRLHVGAVVEKLR